MAIFAVIQQPGPNAEKLGLSITAKFADAHHVLAANIWLVSGSGVARDISDQLGITNGENGSAVVIEAASYFGRANPEIWNWIKTKWEGSAVG